MSELSAGAQYVPLRGPRRESEFSSAAHESLDLQGDMLMNQGCTDGELQVEEYFEGRITESGRGVNSS